jgi:DNA-directed RNA polymerase specialized sigma24 family protein
VVSELTVRRRRSFVLHLQGYVYREIGELLGISESTVGNDVAWIEAEQARVRQIQPDWLMEDGP